MKNVYDLEGNYYEWTAEARETFDRVVRGGGYNSVSYSLVYPASNGYGAGPTATSSSYSARAVLYVNL